MAHAAYLHKRFGFWGAAALGWVTFAGRPAHAEGPTSALSWVRLPGAETCIAAAELGSRIDARLGRSVFVSPSSADVSIEGRVERRLKPAGFHVVVSGTRRDGISIGSRELEASGADCHTLDDSIVLVVSLLIDPDAREGAKPEKRKDPALPTKEVVHETFIVHDVVREQVEPKAPTPWTTFAHVDAGVAVGQLPGVVPSFGLGLRFGTRALGVEVSIHTLPFATTNDGPRSVSYWSIDGGVAFCPMAELTKRVDLGGCAGLRAGSVQANGNGFPQNLENHFPLLDAVAGGRVLAYVGSGFFLLGSVNVVVPFFRERVDYREPDGSAAIVFARSPIGGELVVGVGLRFPR